MSIKLNHTIVNVRDKRESATFFVELFGLPAPVPFGPFLDVEVANEVTLALHRVDGVLNLIAERMRREGGGFDLHDWVSENPGVNEGAAQMALIGPDGMMLSTSMGAQAAPIDLSDREHFRIHLDGGHKGLFISKPVIGRASGKWSIRCSRSGLWR